MPSPRPTTDRTTPLGARRSARRSARRAARASAPASAPTPSGGRLARRALDFVRPFRASVLWVTLLALVLSALAAVDPLLMKVLFDGLAGGEGSTLLWALAAILGLELARAGLGAWSATLTWRVRLDLDFSIRARTLAALTDASLDYHQEQGVGAVMAKVNQSIAVAVAAFAEVAFTLLPSLVYLAISVVAMWRMDWRLAVVALLFAPLPAAIGAWAAREQTDRERRLMDRWTTLYSRLNEVLAGIRTVKLFAMEREERRRFLAGVAEGNGIVLEGVGVDARTGAVRGLVATLARLSVLGVGGWLVLRGDMTAGSLVAFLGYVSGLMGPVQGLTGTYQTMRKATVALETIFGLIDAEPESPDRADAVVAPAIRGDLRFEDVAFAYGEESPVIDGFDLHVRPGETVALVGPSGSGKTTLTALLVRLHETRRGRVLIDGVDVRALTAESLRRNVSVVSQEIHLFNDTVHENIAYGRPGASRAEVEAAARAADAHDFVVALPGGYDTVIGDRGGRLSGGQRQRLAIARALLKDAPVLVFDEATSALDGLSESHIQDALARLRAGRTTLLVAHRLSTVVNADRVVVLADGRILAQGRHEELLHSCAYYASLVSASTDGLLQAA
ncbi:MAG TPA: ABC transporter ATP-binding protein [Gemmatimonadaceae bacterium]|nr:ABC transporter ATP-binding protein [Gemmatimonadaceae bacterium]